MRRRDKIEQMLQAARMYYQDDLGQQEVAANLNVSRQTVSRLLREARAQGIVQVRISDPFATDPDLEARFQAAFSLRQLVLTPGAGLSASALRLRLGVAGAEYLAQTVQDDWLVGLGWGRTLHEVITALNTERQVNVQTIPLIGGIGQLAPSFQVNDLARRLAEAFGGSWRALYAPAFMDDRAAWGTLVALKDVQQVARLWPQMQMALVGIGQFELQRFAGMFLANSLSQSSLAQFEAADAVGDICGRFYDSNGRPVDEIGGVIGIGLEQLRKLDNVVGIAGGADKAAAILGALRGGYLKTLITDTVAAEQVLELHGAAR
ncbi:MAG: sugar-binding transcriptional regulator [Anaerolineales bacterium]|nr:sugar-binding transcriptional regulator [Anaerolineales bacterium]